MLLLTNTSALINRQAMDRNPVEAVGTSVHPKILKRNHQHLRHDEKFHFWGFTAEQFSSFLPKQK